MGLSWRVPGIVSACAIAAACGAGCAKKTEAPAQETSAAADVVTVGPTASPEQVAASLEAILGLRDDAARTKALADFAAGTTATLLEAYLAAGGDAAAQERAFAILVRTAAFVADASLRGRVLDQVLLPVLAAFARDGSDTARATRATEAVGALAAPPAGRGPLLDAAQADRAVVALAGAAAAARQRWACRDRTVRSPGATGADDEERWLVAAVDAVAAVLATPAGRTIQGKGVPLLVDALRESALMQDVSVHRKAAEALARIAPKLVPDSARVAAPALVEALFLRDGHVRTPAPGAPPSTSPAPPSTGIPGLGPATLPSAPSAPGAPSLPSLPSPPPSLPGGRVGAGGIAVGGTTPGGGPRAVGGPGGVPALPGTAVDLGPPGGRPSMTDLVRRQGSAPAAGAPAAGPLPAAPDRPDLVPGLARRALVRLAAAGEPQRNVVLEELLKALNVAPDPDLASRVPELSTAGRNERLALLALPCGSSLGIACAAAEAALRRYVDAGSPPALAECNRGADPTRPGSHFDWGIDPAEIWTRTATALADVLPPAKPGEAPDPATKAGLAVRALQSELELAARWVQAVDDDRLLLEVVWRLYPRAAERAQEGPVDSAGVAPPPAAGSAPLGAAVAKVAAARGPGAGPANPDLRRAWVELAAALGQPDVPAADVEALEPFLLQVLQDVRRDLRALGDLEHEGAEVDRRYGRLAAAAHALGRLGASGPGDEALRDLLRTARFASDRLIGFRVDAERSFPAALFRMPRRSGDDGSPIGAQPILLPLLEAIGSFQRSTPEVLDVLLHVLASRPLMLESRYATIRAEKYDRYTLVNPEVVVFRAAAARAFARSFRADSFPGAGAYVDLFAFLAGDVQYLYALERTGEADPAFQLYPPLPAGGGDAGGEPAADRLAAPPARPPGYGFDAYRQSLAACVLTEEEDRGDVAVWRREFTADQKTAYCTKWVEPWASLHAREMRDQEIPRLSISDNRCWQHMRARHEEQIQYCLDKDNGRTPANELDLTPAQCRQVKDLDDTYLYCGELRFLPEYTEAREPTLWGCYDRFPWLRAREPFGPDCSHIAQRILAAYLYVKLRAEAGAAAADAVTWDGLQSIMTLDEYVRLLRAVAVGPREEDVRRLEALVRELARVQVDVPVFVRPAGAAQTTATRTARRPEGAAEPDFVPLPWYAHAEWVRPEARAFAPLLDGFLLACGPEDQEPGAPATACAPDGGRLKSQMAIRVDDRTPGPLWATAQALAVLLAQEEHTGLFELRQAVADVERRCFAAGTYDPGCLRGLAAEAGDGPRRDRALALLASAPAPDTALLAGVLLDVAHAADASSDLRATAALVLQRTRLECCPRGAAGCDPEPCEQLRFGEFPVRLSAPADLGLPTTAERSTYGPGGQSSGPASAGLAPGTATGATIQSGEATSFGGLSKEVIKRIVRQHAGRIRHCYEAALRTNPELTGRVTVKFVIAPQGNVQSAEAIGNTTGDAAVAECIVAVVRRMVFPQADGVTAVTYPFMLQLTGPEQPPPSPSP